MNSALALLAQASPDANFLNQAAAFFMQHFGHLGIILLVGLNLIGATLRNVRGITIPGTGGRRIPIPNDNVTILLLLVGLVAGRFCWPPAPDCPAIISVIKGGTVASLAIALDSVVIKHVIYKVRALLGLPPEPGAREASEEGDKK